VRHPLPLYWNGRTYINFQQIIRQEGYFAFLRCMVSEKGAAYKSDVCFLCLCLKIGEKSILFLVASPKKAYFYINNFYLRLAVWEKQNEMDGRCSATTRTSMECRAEKSVLQFEEQCLLFVTVTYIQRLQVLRTHPHVTSATVRIDFVTMVTMKI
jgi:hypothetical protein